MVRVSTTPTLCIRCLGVWAIHLPSHVRQHTTPSINTLLRRSNGEEEQRRQQGCIKDRSCCIRLDLREGYDGALEKGAEEKERHRKGRCAWASAVQCPSWEGGSAHSPPVDPSSPCISSP